MNMHLLLANVFLGGAAQMAYGGRARYFSALKERRERPQYLANIHVINAYYGEGVLKPLPDWSRMWLGLAYAEFIVAVVAVVVSIIEMLRAMPF